MQVNLNKLKARNEKEQYFQNYRNKIVIILKEEN